MNGKIIELGRSGKLLKPEVPKIVDVVSNNEREKLRLSAIFNKAISGEQEPFEPLPQISIDVSYGTHGAGKDMQHLAEQFARADIFIPESFGWSPVVLEATREVAEGKKTPKEVLEVLGLAPGTYPFYFDLLKELEMMHGSGKLITFIDVPYVHPLVARQEELASHNREFSNSFEDTLNTIKTDLKTNADFQKEREEYMLSQLRPKILKLLEKYPELQEKGGNGKINVLLRLGAFHTQIYHFLRRKGQDSTREFSLMPYLFLFHHEAERRYMFGKEIDNELLAKVLLERTFYRTFGPSIERITENTSKIFSLLRNIISRFTFEEIEEMFPVMIHEGSFRRLFMGWLQEKGLKIPQSEMELDEFLASGNKSRAKTD